MASSLRTGKAGRVTPAAHKSAWSIAVAASAALALAAGYWAFHPAAAETDSSTNDTSNTAAPSPPQQLERVVPQEATPSPSTPAQPDPSPSAENPPASASPGVSPEPSSDKAADSQARESASVGETVSVSVKVIPSTAILFRGSKRLGEGNATVDVTVGKPAKLVVLHRGYYYRRVKIDGREREVTVRLKKIVPDDAKSDETEGK
ncbi:MAG: hypothetical protein JW940_19515 [Polyangiaceae bacterium]|nr:hypothetical protein [Polyangiaceae bacterium]